MLGRPDRVVRRPDWYNCIYGSTWLKTWRIVHVSAVLVRPRQRTLDTLCIYTTMLLRTRRRQQVMEEVVPLVRRRTSRRRRAKRAVVRRRGWGGDSKPRRYSRDLRAPCVDVRGCGRFSGGVNGGHCGWQVRRGGGSASVSGCSYLQAARPFISGRSSSPAPISVSTGVGISAGQYWCERATE